MPDAYLAKFDATGSHVWSARYGDESSQGVLSLDCDELGQILLSGHFGGSVDFGGGTLSGGWAFAAKLDAEGGHLWSRRYGVDGSQYALWIDAGVAGEAILAGTATGPIDFGGGTLSPEGYGNDLAVVARLDAMGGVIWSAGFEASVVATARAAPGSPGNVFLGGDFWPQIDFGGGPLTVTGGVVDGSTDVFLARFSDRSVPVRPTSFGRLKSRY